MKTSIAMLVAMFPTLGLATSITIDGACSFDLAATGASVSFGASTGDVAVRSQDGTGCGTGTPTPFVHVAPVEQMPVAMDFPVRWASGATVGATPCTPTRGVGTQWATLGPLPPSGEIMIRSPSSPGVVEFGMRCTTTSGPIEATRSATIVLDGSNCSGVDLPSGIAAIPGPTWFSLFGASFPDPLDINRLVTVNQGTSVSIQLVTPLSAIGFLEFTPVSGQSFAEAQVVTSISPCPHDYHETLNTTDAFCLRSPGDNIDLLYRVGAGPAFSCNVAPGRAYYLNVHVGSSSVPDATGAFCARPSCGWLGGARAQ